MEDPVKIKDMNVNQENLAPSDPNHAQKTPLEVTKAQPDYPITANTPSHAKKPHPEDPNKPLYDLKAHEVELGSDMVKMLEKPNAQPQQTSIKQAVVQPPASFQPQKVTQVQSIKIAPQVDKTPLPEETQLFMITEDGALRTAKICDSKLQKMNLISAGTKSEWCNFGQFMKNPWNSKRLKLLPEIGMLSFLETPTRILLIDIFRRHQHLRNVSALMVLSDPESDVPKLNISSCILKSEHLALQIEIAQGSDDYWSDLFVDLTVQQTRGEPTEPSIGLLTDSGLLYCLKLESKIKCRDPCDIYKGLKSWRKPFIKFAVHRTQTVDGRIFVIGMTILLTQVL